MRIRKEIVVNKIVLGALIAATSAWCASRPAGEGSTRPRWTRLSSSNLHTCAIRDDGALVCWGFNNAGQVGNGTFTTPITSPALVTNLPNAVVSVSAGSNHTCGVTINNAVVCWGSNSQFQLGNSAANSATPVGVSGLNNVVAVAAGGAHSCAILLSGSVMCWGSNSAGQLGAGVDPSVMARSAAPVLVSHLANVRAISAGTSHTCALVANGTVKCWGSNDNGQLGNGSTGGFSTTPGIVSSFIGATGAVPAEIASGLRYNCVRLSDGTVNCWGDNSAGQLGNGSATSHGVNHPVVASVATSVVVGLSSGSDDTCAILVNGTVQCWGANDANELGGGTPVPGVSNVVEIASGADHNCARNAGGTIQCWGLNSFGEHGDGGISVQTVDQVLGITGLVSARAVSAGSTFTCATRGTGTAACWGRGDSGQLGNSGSANSPNAVAVTGITNAVSLTTGDKHACIVDATGIAKCWGDGTFGQLGNGVSGAGTRSTQPVTVTSTFPFIAISAGFTHTCAVTAGFGLIRCWGSNASGQLGTGDQNTSSVSVQSAGIANAVAVAAGNKFTCALVADGTVSCWGDNSLGQLGDGGAELFTKIPKQVAGLANIVGISAGDSHVCAVSVSGSVSCWGGNSRGQIGNNTALTANLPVIAQGLSDALSVSGGGLFTCAVRTFGGADCWGANSAGELSTKDSLSHLTPALVIGGFVAVQGVSVPVALGGVTAITAGAPSVNDDEQACALGASGRLLCWGGNDFGQIGDGTNINRPLPTVVNSFTANVDPAATLASSGRIVTVTALINCEEGAEAHLILTLTQGATTGSGRAIVNCTGFMLREPMVVPAVGPDGFQSGAAVANVEAIVIDRGKVLEDQHWTRAVTLAGQ